MTNRLQDHTPPLRLVTPEKRNAAADAAVGAAAVARAPLPRRDFHRKLSQNRAQHRESISHGRTWFVWNRRFVRRRQLMCRLKHRDACMSSLPSQRFRQNAPRTVARATRRWLRGLCI